MYKYIFAIFCAISITIMVTGSAGLAIGSTCCQYCGPSKDPVLSPDPCKYIKCGGGPGGGSAPSGSQDPNSLDGPGGYGPQHFVETAELLPYRINFENDKSATAPAQNVTVKNPLAAGLDWSTFQLTEIAFGDHFVSVPAGTQHFTRTEKMTYNNVTFDVQIEAGLRLTTGDVYANFQSIDPATGLPPAVEIGFLPPENGTGRGQGHVSYTVRQKAGLTTGSEVRNIATIVFDGQTPITTDQIDPHDATKGVDPAKQALVTVWTATLPIVATGEASGIGGTTATVSGSVSPNNYPTSVTFEYGLTTDYGSTAAATPSSVTGTAVQTVVANLTGLQPVTTYHYRINGVNSLGTWLGNDATFTTATPPVTVSLTIAGTGSGSVNSTPNDPVNGIACDYPPPAGKCSSTQLIGSQFTLNAVTGELSLFDGWSDGCQGCGATPACPVTFDLDKSCTATFTRHLPVLMTGTYYADILSAYKLTVADTTIEAQTVTFTGSHLFDKAVRINLKGGFDADYQNQTGTTAINGAVTVRKGMLVVDRLVIR